MNDAIIEEFARGLIRCPFEPQLFDSAKAALSLRLHLCESHLRDIQTPHRIARPKDSDPDERPRTLYCCPHCDFAAPQPGNQNPIDAISKHIQAQHPNPFGPAQIGFRLSDDETVIDNFVDMRESVEVCVCTRCDRIYANEAAVAEHWIEMHCDSAVTVEEARSALTVEPERFRTALADCLAEIAENEFRRTLSFRAPDDGYEIRHSPNVPRVRTTPTEGVIYVEREAVMLIDREIDELFKYEGLDIADEGPLNQSQTARVELRFCNIEDGYIPLVQEVRMILPLLADGDLVEVCWQDQPESWFPCTVSRAKRAVYNIEGRLKDLLKPLPSGVWLYITRLEPRRYRIGAKRKPHKVLNCKVFLFDDADGWNVVSRDELIEWETNEDVFKHQLNFSQIEALHDEATRTGLSVKDAVYEVMKRHANSDDGLHVRAVHDIVFWRRNCSLAAVWAQFRPEHACYARIKPGYYRFDATKPRPPTIRTVSRPVREVMEAPRIATHDSVYPVRQRYGRDGRFRFNIYRSRLGDYQNKENACLEVRCAFGAPDELVFSIPISFLAERVIPQADCNERGQYLFTVNRHDLVFTWDHGFRMEGTPFCVTE